MNDDGDAAAAAAVVCWHCSHGRAAPPPPLPYWWWWWCRYSFEVFVVPASELLLSLRAAAVHATSSATRPSPMAQATRHADATMRMRTPLPSPFLSLSCLVLYLYLYFLLLLVAQTDRQEREYAWKRKGWSGEERDGSFGGEVAEKRKRRINPVKNAAPASRIDLPSASRKQACKAHSTGGPLRLRELGGAGTR